MNKFRVNLSTTRFKLRHHSWPYVPELTWNINGHIYHKNGGRPDEILQGCHAFQTRHQFIVKISRQAR